MPETRLPEWAELDRIAALYETAKTPREYLEADRLFFLVDPELRRAWLADQAKEWT